MLHYLYKCDSEVYVVLRTGLGFVALSLTDYHCFGVARRTIAEAVDGLTPTGLKIDALKSRMLDPAID